MLNKITVTGADDETNIREMTEISKEFPYVEWGILVGREYEGKSRFPIPYWQDHFKNVALKNNLNVSCHICGKGVEQILLGNETLIRTYIGDLSGFYPYPPILDCAQRVQLNTHGIAHKFSIEKFKELVNTYLYDKQIIIQYDNVNNGVLFESESAGINVVPLFDLSHGAGVLPREWPKPVSDYCGYAGGLSPSNVLNQLNKISIVTSDIDYWIDAETHLRSVSKGFDLNLVKDFLKKCEPLII